MNQRNETPKKTVLNTGTKVIGDTTYKVAQLPYGEARPIIWLAMTTLLPALEALGGWKMAQGMAALGDLDIAVIGKAFRLFFDRATAEDYERVENLFTQQTLVKLPGSKQFITLASVRDLHWPNRYADLFSWLWFSVEVHFGPFSRASVQGAQSDLEDQTTS
jgi:hypothetical protein